LGGKEGKEGPPHRTLWVSATERADILGGRREVIGVGGGAGQTSKLCKQGRVKS